VRVRVEDRPPDHLLEQLFGRRIARGRGHGAKLGAVEVRMPGSRTMIAGDSCSKAIRPREVAASGGSVP
jgi:hypothetical protein